MRADEKIWNVVYAISQARQIRPSNEPCKISPSVFSKMSQDEVDGIFKKLDKDDDVINLINVPKSWAVVTANSRPDDYRYVFGVKESFDDFYENKYREYYQAIHNLATENFLSIFDLVLDIEREIQMSDSNKVTVDVLNHIVRFSILFPRDSAHFRDAYCKRRIDSANYLKRHGAIKSYTLQDNVGNGWEAKIEVEFSTPAFDGFADKMKARYKTDFHQQQKLVIDKQPMPKLKKPDDTVLEPEKSDTPIQAPIKTPLTKVDIHPLQPNHYHDKTGKLAVSPTVDVSIAVRGKVTRKNRSKYDQCHLMSCLFKSVNTLNNGTTFSKFLGVKYDKNSKTHIRKIRNTVDEINKKVAEKTTAKKLIFIQGDRIIVNHSYLKN